MPKIYVEIPDLNDTVIRPIVTHFAETILATTAVKDEIGLSYKGERNITAIPGSKLGDTVAVKWAKDDGRVKATIEDEVDMTRYRDRTLDSVDAQPTCHEPGVGLAVYPIYEPHVMRITLSYRAESKQDAQHWRNEVKRHFMEGHERTPLEATYSYMIPSIARTIIKLVYDASQKKLPEELQEDIGTWYQRTMSDRVVLLTNLNGEHDQPAVSETQTHIIGFLSDPDGEVEIEEDSSQAEVSLAYEIHYDCPKRFVVDYPLFINNSLIPKAFIPKPPYDLNELVQEFGKISYALEYFRDRGRIDPIRYGVKMPYYDEWIPPKYYLDQYLPILTVGVCYNPDSDVLLNIGQLGRLTIKSEVLEFIKANHRTICADFQTLFRITLFEGDDSVETGVLVMDSDLTLRTTVPLDIRGVYRISIAILRHPYDIGKDRINDMRNYGALADYIARSAGIELPEARYRSDGSMHIDDFLRRIESYARKMGDPMKGYQLMINVCQFMTVVGRI